MGFMQILQIIKLVVRILELLDDDKKEMVAKVAAKKVNDLSVKDLEDIFIGPPAP